MSLDKICNNINTVSERIASACLKAGREPSEITLVAVSKTKPNDFILSALKCGQLVFGENKMQELEKKMNDIERSDIVWHMIGTMQSNKIKYIQVNISGEDQKSGCEPEEISKILDYAKNLSHVKVRGFMGIATFVDNPELVRPEFKLLKKLLTEHQQFNNGSNIQLDQLSMGMSADMEVAIEEGATMVRVGSDIFGSRNYQ